MSEFFNLLNLIIGLVIGLIIGYLSSQYEKKGK